MYFEKFCKTCPRESHCCTFDHEAGFTFLTPQDAQRIQKATGKQFLEFVEYTHLPKKAITALKNDDPALEGAIRYSQLDSRGRILRLKKKADNTCIFLEKNGKCGIYASRPNICRIYPFWAVRLIDGNLKIISHDSTPRCPIVKSLVKKNDADTDIEDCLSTNQKKAIKDTFQAIESEKRTYTSRIIGFSKKISHISVEKKIKKNKV